MVKYQLHSRQNRHFPYIIYWHLRATTVAKISSGVAEGK